jgi:predicted acetyltransferase
MVNDTIQLIEPTADLAEEFLGMIEEYQTVDSPATHSLTADIRDLTGKPAGLDFQSYVCRLSDWSCGKNLPEGLVPQTTFWLVREPGRLLGCARFRHYLNPELEYGGGHIGYDVRPSERGKGYGNFLLARMLDKARAMGIGRILMVTDAENEVSRKIIIRHGGRLENSVPSKHTGRPLLRFWIE